MRYLDVTKQSLPLLIFFTSAGLFGDAPLAALAVALIAAAFGLLPGHYMSCVVRDYLLFGKSHWLIKSYPREWIWVIAGLWLGGVHICWSLLETRPNGLTIVLCASTGFGSFCMATFGMVTLNIHKLEQEQGMWVLMGPSGLSFDENAESELPD
jgi:hypothetical protein